VDRVKPERNLGAAKPPGGERRDEHPARKGFHHGTAVYGPVCTVVWELRLEAHGRLWSAMAILTKLSQQSSTESCAVCGNKHREA
jgi:hypothetical protein